jgi:hypothetical protein
VLVVFNGKGAVVRDKAVLARRVGIAAREKKKMKRKKLTKMEI